MTTGDRLREMAAKLNIRAKALEAGVTSSAQDTSQLRAHGLRLKAVDLLAEAEKSDQIDTLIEVLVGIRGSVNAL